MLANLGSWVPELRSVPYLDDSSVHEQMVRFASHLLSTGRNPLANWFPFLNEGSPQYLHYQALPSIITGALGIFTGANVAFRLTLFLLLGLWPVCVYVSARVWGLSAATAAIVGSCSALLSSATSIGYESHAYIWTGYGVWTQLWGAWALSLAWAFTWRSTRSNTACFAASICIALTIALHFETGYLAVAGSVIIPLVGSGSLGRRILGSVKVLIPAALMTLWVTIPLVAQGTWTSTNQALAGTSLENGYGLRTLSVWMLDGRIFDSGRVPLITALVAVGLGWSVIHWRDCTYERTFVVLFFVCIILASGRTTFGPLVQLLPANRDIFMRRFMMGVQLSGLMLAGVGARWIGTLILSSPTRWQVQRSFSSRPWSEQTLAGLLMIAALTPAMIQMHDFAAYNNSQIARQIESEQVNVQQIGPLISFIKEHPVGRTYAGSPSNWGPYFKVGMVPVFKYLEDQNVDLVGYTIRTASLMSMPEYNFVATNPADYISFGISYLLLPSSLKPPVPALRIMVGGPFSLWRVPHNGYFSLVSAFGTIAANRSNIGEATKPFLESDLASRQLVPVMVFGGNSLKNVVPISATAANRPLGKFTSSSFSLNSGRAFADVTIKEPSFLLLSASYDPGWQVWVDGTRRSVVMFAPAVPGVALKPGSHTVVFEYVGFPDYTVLMLVGAFTLLMEAALLLHCRLRRQRRKFEDADSAELSIEF